MGGDDVICKVMGVVSVNGGAGISSRLIVVMNEANIPHTVDVTEGLLGSVIFNFITCCYDGFLFRYYKYIYKRRWFCCWDYFTALVLDDPNYISRFYYS